MDEVELNDVRWLVSPDGQRALDRLPSDVSPTPKVITHLRRDHSAVRVSLLMQQCELRRRAKEKFLLADRLFFTERSLMQATDCWTATYKAGQLPARDWVDVCSGIGGDLLAMATRSTGEGVEQDPVLALLAAANVEALQLTSPIRAETATPDMVTGKVLHIDPDRRVEGRRTTQLEYMSPALETIDRFIAESSWASVKLAPATPLPPHWEGQVVREWIECRGTVRQQWIRFEENDLPHRATRVVPASQTKIPACQSIHWSGHPDESCEFASGEIDRFFYEPSNAILAAGLAGSLARHLQLRQPFAQLPYFTSDPHVEHPFLSGFEVLHVLPFDVKRVKRILREHQYGSLTVKKRGTPLDPAQIRKQLRVPGDNPITLFVAGTRDRTMAILATRL